MTSGRSPWARPWTTADEARFYGVGDIEPVLKKQKGVLVAMKVPSKQLLAHRLCTVGGARYCPQRPVLESVLCLRFHI